MTLAVGRWILALLPLLALGPAACGGEEDGQPADPAMNVMPEATLPVPSTPAAQGQASAAAPDQPAATAARPESPGARAGVNWYPNPPPCVDCPIAPPPSGRVAPAPEQARGNR